MNAVLRRAAREARGRVEALPDRTPAEAALRHSHPEWVAALWFELLGPGAARALMAAGNEPAEAALRANLLRTTPAELAERLPVPSRPADGVPEGLVLDEPFDAFSSPLWEEGLFMPQSRAAMAVARVLAPQPGERVLDLCAAPGGKTTHLAALMEDQGTVVAVERHPGRAEALRRTAARMGASSVEVSTADAAAPHEPAAYDRVLVDPPCSDLGTLASRPDARWRKTAGQVEELAGVQMRDPAGRRGRRCGPAARSSTPRARSRPPRTSGSWSASSPSTTTSAPTTCAASRPSGSIRRRPCSSRRFPTATARTASSSPGCGGAAT